MERNDGVLTLKDTTANPAPLGLLGFGMTTILLNLHNVGFYELNAMIIGMGIFVGGIAQLIAGVMEFKKNNTFGATAFTAYGSFWISLVLIWLLPRTTIGAELKPTPESMGWFLAVWGVFSAFMFVGTLKMNRVMQIVFGTLVALFALLAIGDFSGSEAVTKLAGAVGIVCGSMALYASVAQILNEVYGRTLLPLGAK